MAMRTNIDIDEKLLLEAFKYLKVKTKKELVNTALKEFIENHKRKNLMELKGKIAFREDYDHKKMREGV
jgi:Arc/MetJ family transcription regulator